MADRYLIAIASYRRPTDLQKLLDSLDSGIGPIDADILVVDNDPTGSARSVAVRHPLRPIYAVEPKPGIAEARNRALDYFGVDYAGIVFVDDDEWVTPGWLSTLTNYAKATESDVVMGPVLSVLPATTPEWIRRGGFFQRPLFADGQELRTAATNNTLLLRPAWINAGSPRFDPTFSETGGSDTDLFRGICKSGARIRFCADAVVYENVPSERMSLRWLRRRATRNGIVQTRVRLKHGDSLIQGLAGAVIYAGYGVLFSLISLARGRGLQAKPFNYLFLGYGRVAALFNYRIREYARSSKP